jgi:hypothetical protein
MIAKEDTEMNFGWGRVLIGIGVIVALLALGALEVVTTRLSPGEAVVEQRDPDDAAAGPWRDFLDMRAQFTGQDLGASVNERSEADRAVAAAQDPSLQQ